jgi:hypothetical protein
MKAISFSFQKDICSNKKNATRWNLHFVAVRSNNSKHISRGKVSHNFFAFETYPTGLWKVSTFRTQPLSRAKALRLPTSSLVATPVNPQLLAYCLWGPRSPLLCATLGDIRRHWQFSKKSSMRRWVKLGEIR